MKKKSFAQGKPSPDDVVILLNKEQVHKRIMKLGAIIMIVIIVHRMSL